MIGILLAMAWSGMLGYYGLKGSVRLIHEIQHMRTRGRTPADGQVWKTSEGDRIYIWEVTDTRIHFSSGWGGWSVPRSRWVEMVRDNHMRLVRP